MGHNSNRGETKPERISRFAKEVSRCRDTSSFEWQTSVGAEIRGRMGVDRGNKFIAAVRGASR